VAAGRASG